MFSMPVLKQTVQTSALALVIALAGGSAAKADFPGEVWSVDALVIRNDGNSSGLMTKDLRAGLQGANDVYFYGERPMRMVVEGLPGATTAMRLTLIEQATGEVLARSARLEISGGSKSIKAKALAWMEGLNCAASGCAVAPEAPQPVRVAKGRVDTGLKSETSVSHHGRITGPGLDPSGFGVPVPVSRPGAGPVSGKRGKAKIYPTGLSAKEINAALSSLQIAWAIPREVGALTYSDADRIVLDDAIQLARATPLAPVAALPVRPVETVPTVIHEEKSLFVRLIDGFADLFTIGPGSDSPQPTVVVQKPVQPVVSVAPATNTVVVAKPQEPVLPVAPEAETTEVASLDPTPEPVVESIVKPADSRSVWTRASDAVTLINPVERFRNDPNLRGVSDGERIAVADLRTQLTDPANIRATQLPAGSVDPAELLRPSSREDDILRATAQPTRQTTTKFSVKLHPELLGRYSGPALAGLTPRRNQRLKKQPSVGARKPADASNLNAVLKERGLELNLAGYNRFERLYWGGEGDEGFWISMPNRVNAKFVLVSGPTSSVIAAVRRRNGIARVSSGVAEALELQPREWSKLRIISLRPDNQSAALPFLVWSSVLKGRDVVTQ